MAALCLLLAGCGGSAAAPSPTATPRRATSPPATATIVASSGSTPTPGVTSTPTATPRTSPTATVSARPKPTATRPAPGGETPSVVSASLRPATVAPGGGLTVTVIMRGQPAGVEAYLGSGSPSGPAPQTFVLTSSGGGTWTAGGRAPSVPGAYHYTVGVFNGAGRRSIVDHDSWNITVSGASSSSASATLPDDIPLAPPFSYSNPTPAVFNWSGSTVNGAEVDSTRRPDVAPSVVAQWYVVHFPRSGWTVQESPAGGSSFTVGATKAGGSGTRVCIVQYADFTVHIFYGTLGS